MATKSDALPVLLIDDEPAIRRVLGALIADFGYDVHTVGSADEAIEFVQQQAFPLVVSDIRMPGMDGITLLQKLKELCPDTLVLMITGHGDKDSVVRCLRLGASDFIDKPVNEALLEHALARCADTFRLRRALREHQERLEMLVEERTRELLETQRVAIVGETVSGMAHSIKNMAFALDGSLYVLEEGFRQGDAEIQAHGWSMLRETVSRVRDRLLALLRAGKPLELHPVFTSPAEPALQALRLIQAKADSLGVQLIFDTDEDMSPVLLDVDEVRHCLENLLVNALEAFPPPSARSRHAEIRVGVRRADGWLEYRVEDTGTGLSAEAAAKLRHGIFTTKPDGTGFGLLTTRKALVEMGGRLEFASASSGGAVFVMRLPAERQPS